MRMMVRLASALLLLAAASAAQVRVAPPAALAPLGVPALLVGTPGAPAPSLAAALAVQTGAISAMPAPAAAQYLVAQAAAPEPAVRAAAMILAARASPVASATPSPARDDRSPAAALHEVAEAARREPALSAWFDGAAPSLALDGLELDRRGWTRGGTRLERLGQGSFGFVDAHPALPGVVLKTVAVAPELVLFSDPEPQQVAELEQATARALAEADAGPRHLGRALVQGVEVSARERVHGQTLEELARAKKLGPAEDALVRELVGRLAAAGLMPDDLRASNVMIGRTELDPRRRAYVIDGGRLQSYPAGLAPEARPDHLLDMPVVLRGRMDPNMGWVETVGTLREFLARGLERSSRDTRWKRFAGFWRDLGRAFHP